MDGLGRMFTLILAGVLMFMIPLRGILINYQNYTQNHIQEEINKFVDDVREKGYMTLEMYEKIYKTLNPSNDIYEIELIHSVLKEGQISSNNQGLGNYKEKSEVLGALMTTCSNGHTYEIDFDSKESKCQVCFETIAGFDIDIVENVIEKDKDIKAFLTLVYLDGHTKVIEEGFTHDLDFSVLGTRQVTFFYEDIEGTESVTVVETLKCDGCGNLFSYGSDYSSEDEESGILFDNSLCITCNNKVLKITADSDFYTLSLGENLEIEVIAIYPNDRREKIESWTSSFNPNKPGLQQVMIYYENVITSVKVFVESEDQEVCTNCNTVYSNIEYLKCPSCSKFVTGIETTLTEGSKIKLGRDLSLSVIYIYYDGSREIVKEGYEVIGYDPYKLGNQTISIRLGEYEVSQLIEVVEQVNTNVCPQGHYYFLRPNDSKPNDLDGEHACPYCENSQIETELTNTYNDIKYTNEILDEIKSNGIYYFNEGDYFTVNVHVANGRISRKPYGKIFLSNKQSKYSYGGIVHDNFF